MTSSARDRPPSPLLCMHRLVTLLSFPSHSSKPNRTHLGKVQPGVSLRSCLGTYTERKDSRFSLLHCLDIKQHGRSSRVPPKKTTTQWRTKARCFSLALLLSNIGTCSEWMGRGSKEGKDRILQVYRTEGEKDKDGDAAGRERLNRRLSWCGKHPVPAT